MAFPTVAVNTANMDAGTDSVSNARGDILLAVQHLNSIKDFFAGTEVVMAAATTTDIGSQNSNKIALTSGSAAITSFGTTYNGTIFVRVATTCSITYNATTMITQGAVNIPLRPGDWFIATPKASGGAANGWYIITAPWTGLMATNGAVPDTGGLGFTLGRGDTSAEGGQINLCRASDNAIAWVLDVYGTGASPNVRLIKSGGGVVMEVDTNGNVGFGAGTPTAQVDIGGNTLRVRTAKTPASAGAVGNQGDYCWDASYFYICIATNTWRRTAHATW